MIYLKKFESMDFEEDWEEEFSQEEDDHDIIRNINNDFYDFLIDKGIIDQYIEIYNLYGKEYNGYDNLEDFLKNSNPRNYIVNAFDWAQDFDENIDWFDKNYYWQNFYRNN